MTRDQVIEMVQDRLVQNHPGVDTDDMFSPQMIGIHLEVVYATVLNQIIEQQEARNGSAELNSYSVTYRDLEVKVDTKRDQKYIELPVKVADLKDQKAIRLVAPNKDAKSFFFGRRPGAHNAMMQCLDVNNREDGIYVLEGDRIYFERIDEDLELMQAAVIPALESLGDDAEITLPRQGETNVIDMVYKMLVSKYGLPADNVNDQTRV